MSFKELAVPVYLKDGKALQRPEGGKLVKGVFLHGKFKKQTVLV